MLFTLADTITADMGLIPGLAFVGPAFGLPLSVLAAFLERPFYTLGGITRQTIWYSLRANLVSLLIGYVAMFVMAGLSDALRSEDVLFSAWPVLAVAVSILVEGLCLQRWEGYNRVFWPWNAVGNILSAAACVALLFFINYLYDHHHRWSFQLESLTGPLTYSAFGGSVFVFALAFWKTRGTHARRQSEAESTES